MRIAVLTHAFPPSRHANGKRPYYIVKGLLDAGWEVDVYTSDLGCDSGAEEILDHTKARIIRVPDPVVRWLERVKPLSWLYKLFVSTTNGLLWPDFYAPWVKQVIRNLRRERGGYDRTLAFVFPPSMYLTHKHGLVDDSWVFDLQESVTPQYRKFPRRSPLQRARQPKVEELERNALHSAGKVVFTANTNRNAYIDAGIVPKERTTHIPYFYDADAFLQMKDGLVSKDFEIRYFGTFDWQGNRSPKIFLGALSKFLKYRPEAREKTRFVFYGSWLSEHNVLITDLGLSDVVDIRAAVPYSDYLNKLIEATVLLLVIAPEHNLFMPSKIVDYFGAKRPILAFVPNESEMHSVLGQAGMSSRVVAPDDSEGAAMALDCLWYDYLKSELGTVNSQTERWSSSTIVPNYVEKIQGMQG